MASSMIPTAILLYCSSSTINIFFLRAILCSIRFVCSSIYSFLFAMSSIIFLILSVFSWTSRITLLWSVLTGTSIGTSCTNFFDVSSSAGLTFFFSFFKLSGAKKLLMLICLAKGPVSSDESYNAHWSSFTLLIILFTSSSLTLSLLSAFINSTGFVFSSGSQWKRRESTFISKFVVGFSS